MIARKPVITDRESELNQQAPLATCAHGVKILVVLLVEILSDM